MPASEESLDTATDFELLRKTASGDGSAFAAFVGRHQAAVYRHAAGLAAHREDAEDLLQETFLSAFKAAGQFRGESSGRTWLFQITRHAALRRCARPTTISETDLPLDTLALQAGWGTANPESLAILAEDQNRLKQALAALPKDEREILLLREWEKISGDEAAALLGISQAAMKSRLHRARIHLGALLRGGIQGKEA